MKELLYLILAISTLSFSACRDEGLIEPPTEQEVSELEVPDWTDYSHGNTTQPDYEEVFNQTRVMRLDINIDADNWEAMIADLNENLNTSTGPGGGGPGGGPGGNIGGGAPVTTSDFEPIWAPCTLSYNDTDWYQVGIRFKGNSSLSSAFSSGNNKLSLKLDFDEFDSDYPQISNQRFYGFRQLNLNNNFSDASLMREKVAADLFRAFGIIAPQTRFCIVYLNHGQGSQYYGVYTLVEEVDDTVLETQAGDDSGNLYKPDGTAASFAAGTYNDAEMEKKNNEDVGDYSDVKSLYEIINSSSRTTDTETWKQELESVFDVEVFLKWLAANTIIQNWDTYGKMTHNYYLYQHHSTNKINWIPWDNNESLSDGKLGGTLSLSLSEVSGSWPLIRYIMDIPSYEEQYKAYAQQFITHVFVPEELNMVYESYYQMLAEYAYAEESGYTYIYSNADFDNEVSYLKSHVVNRNTITTNYLGK